MIKRSSFYVDGFNLYHAIDGLGRSHLKWLSLWDLGSLLIPRKSEVLSQVVYFSAFATHRPDSMLRHRAYVEALQTTGVECIMGRFKHRNVHCHACGNRWKHPEEKETDVHIAVRIVDDAYQDSFDVCYLISGDTDLVPAIKILRKQFPTKEFVTLSTPGRPHSAEILRHASRKQKIKPTHIERSLFPETIIDPNGKQITRPKEYTPPV
ncbi:MAG: NYN domain-containing protein [Geminicoccaceae bacterium]